MEEPTACWQMLRMFYRRLAGKFSLAMRCVEFDLETENCSAKNYQNIVTSWRTSGPEEGIEMGSAFSSCVLDIQDILDVDEDLFSGVTGPYLRRELLEHHLAVLSGEVVPAKDQGPDNKPDKGNASTVSSCKQEISSMS
eukprot:TRINITY_DN31245_c0_g1_i1.p1 TRINITY_DN31245_c0_g1~~TRINITY_DN31245_c0_g1_i1.p1  ORF type:complete len:139 (+),score=21.21 TRINITY_DN31245_c0_g1_i1:72-488(+)